MINKLFLILTALFLCVLLTDEANAQQPDPTVNTNPSVTEPSAPEATAIDPDSTRAKRSKRSFYFSGEYSYVDLLIPGKYGGHIGLVENADTAWELEYLRASLSVPFIIEDLGKMTDQRISLLRRSYLNKNTFSIVYGLSYFSFDFVLGDKLLNNVSGGAYPSIDLIEVDCLGAHIGVGNRWIFGEHFSLGVDWVSWSQPLVTIKKDAPYLNYVSNQQDRENVEKAVNAIMYLPRISLMKIQLGFYF